MLPIILICIGSLGYWSYTHSRNALYKSEEENMNLLLNEAVHHIISSRYDLLEQAGLTDMPAFVESYQEEVFNELNNLATVTNRRYFIIGQDGTPIYCSDSKDPSVLSQWSELAQSQKGQSFGSFQALDDINTLYASAAFNKPDWNWVIFVSRPEAEVTQQVSIIQLVTIGVSLVSILLMGGLLTLVTRRLLIQPINHLQKAASHIAKQEPIGRIGVTSNDELGDLARDMEGMSEAIKNKIEEVQVANRAKSMFLAHMSHELRSPLNSILGYADLALGDKDIQALPQETQNYIKTISSSGNHLMDLIGDILDFSKIEAGELVLEKSAMSLAELVEETSSMMVLAAREKNNTLDVTFPDNIHRWVLGDSVRLRQILMNFLSNAVKFTTDGTITLRVSLKSEDEFTQKLRFEVSDQGIGIPKSKQSSLFSAFSQADVSTTRNYGGTGLGLAINKQLVLAMDGQIGVDSEEEKGSTFWFEVTLDKTKALFRSQEEVPEHDLTNLHLLLVEDIKVNQIMAKALLEKSGQSVDTADNGFEAVEKVTKNDYDIILMDIHMPDMDGVEATKQIRALADTAKSTVPIIALTADIETSNLKEYIACGMNATCSKPLNMDDLLKTLKRLIHEKSANAA
ncbi:ATP-binding protein [uncultured Kiloniella sp.]|uniref:ATP-binding protein n=1 Tax=uncultured Kiloniella sp. TaxID=1133091 RepID=UPI002618B379|nr:ATP-binding protein [uncultured Kiloniella sp.]